MANSGRGRSRERSRGPKWAQRSTTNCNGASSSTRIPILKGSGDSWRRARSPCIAASIPRPTAFISAAWSLCIGLRRFQLAGHRPIALMGGGTGLIGDPSGRTAERGLNDKELVDTWVEKIRLQVEPFLDFSPGPYQAQLRQQLRLAEFALRHRVPSGRGQTLLGQLHVGQGVGARPSRAGGHLLHRVQLHDPPVLRLPAPGRARMAAGCRWAAAINGATSPQA